MRRRLVVGAAALALGGCGVFLGLDQPTYDAADAAVPDATRSDTGADGAPNTADTFADATRWSTYTKAESGYVPGPYDGHYVYFVRQLGDVNVEAGIQGGMVLRYDPTAASFDDDTAWSTFAPNGNFGFVGNHVAAVMEGHWLVLAAYQEHRFLRFDTTRPAGDFELGSSWESFDATALGDTLGYTSAAPIDGGAFFHNGAHLVPLEHHGDAFATGFQASPLDAGVFGCANTAGAACAGSQLFFGPQPGAQSCLARFDQTVPFGSNAGWDSVDLATLGDEQTQMEGVVASPQHLYVTQVTTRDAAAPVKVLRRAFATNGGLDAGWEAQPTNVKNPLARGFSGGAFDGRYMYFAPYPVAPAPLVFARYDTTLAFSDANAWSETPGDAVGIPANRYAGAVFDGQYVYFASYQTLDNAPPTFVRFKAYDQKIAVPPTCF